MTNDARKHQRLDVELHLTYIIEGQDVSGAGRLLDVSLDGACFQIDRPFVIKRGLMFDLHSADVPALPRRAQLRWYRKLPLRPPVFLCGVTFEETTPAWDDWVASLAPQAQLA